MNISKITLSIALILILAFGIQWLLFPLFIILVIERNFGYLQSSDFLTSLLPLLLLFVFLLTILGFALKILTKKHPSGSV